MPLSGEENLNAAEANPMFPSHASDGLSRSRSTTISTSAASSSRSYPFSLESNPSSDSHELAPDAFPIPPTHPPRAANLYDLADQDEKSYPSQASIRPRVMSRSLSQPVHLQFLPEGYIEGKHRHSTNRISDPATGIHSKNAALLSAESGGMMLAFSPSGNGVWRQGQLIVGGSTGLIPTPFSHQSEQIASREKLQARPWSETSMSNHQDPRPGLLGPRGRSLSEGATLARQGTLLHPASSNKRASAELGVMLGGQKWMRPVASKLLPPPELEGWQAAGGDAKKVRLEASKKRKARVQVDVVLERECVVEGGDIRGRMEVRVTGGRKVDGLRVGGGKVRVVGFEGSFFLLQ